MQTSYVTFTKSKLFRFLAYLIDLLLMILVCYLIDRIYPIFHFDTLAADIATLKAALSDTDINLLASSLANDFASISLKVVIVLELYEFISFLLFHQTIGKAIFHLQLEQTDVLHTLLRCLWKGFSQIFLGGIIFLLSLFAIIASPRDISLHDRFSKTKVSITS